MEPGRATWEALQIVEQAAQVWYPQGEFLKVISIPAEWLATEEEAGQ